MNATLLLIIILSIFVVFLSVHAILVHIKLKKLFAGKNGKDLESIILNIQERLSQYNAHAIKNSSDVQILEARLRKSLRGVKTMRFKPFEDAGSNQSFAIAFIDDEQNGVILSSLYTRERMSVFAKPIRNGNSEYELTKEEKSVLEESKNNY